MTDRTGAIRTLLDENAASARLAGQAEQVVTRALAHEGRRRPATKRRSSRPTGTTSGARS